MAASFVKSPREVAIDVVHEFVGRAAMSRGLLLLLTEDTGEQGTTLRRLRDVVEKAIELDRLEQRKANAPS